IKEGFDRQLFRVLRISPGLNYRTSRITAQIHDDRWYVGGIDGSLGVIGGGRQANHEIGLPRPLAGAVLDEDGESDFVIEEQPIEGADGTYNLNLAVSFTVPTKVSVNGPGIPLLSLSPDVSDAGGTLRGGLTYYYAVSAVSESGAESPLSFIVRADVPGESSTNSVTLRELSFAPGSTGFHVYRGITPSQLLRIATNEAIGGTHTDNGSPMELASPPDSNYHHANFYWRLELVPETSATSYSKNAIGSDTLQMLEDEYRGKVVRITAGKGRSQERFVLSNSDRVLTLATDWDIEPDGSSAFVVADSSWNFGAMTQSSPVVFQIPNRTLATIHVSGRSANVHDKECSYELSPLTRYTIGGAAGGMDADVSPVPIFGLTSSGQGAAEVSGVGFEDLANTSTISAASLTVHYVDELTVSRDVLLTESISAETAVINISVAGGAEAGSLLQIGREVLEVTEVTEEGHRYSVTRGCYGTEPAVHDLNASIYHLKRRVFILPFPRNFFGSPASGNYSFPVLLADARIAAAEMFVTNARGNSPVALESFTANESAGIRTLSGGQLVMQVEGHLAIQSNAVPRLTIEATHACRDIFATVSEAPADTPIQLRLTVDGATYSELTIEPGETISNVIDGFQQEPLQVDSVLGLDVVSVGQGAGKPGKDLTVSLRF
ncbi:MAG: hypothetical protein ACRD7E_26305, partial [Bryobacteraceae bacterium]